MNSLWQLQTNFNTTTVDRWEEYADHRNHVGALLSPRSASERPSLCVLGAGNCNDLDLNLLLGRLREIHLVDLDTIALERGIARQGLAGNRALIPHGGIDVTGMLDIMAGWSPFSAIETSDVANVLDEPIRRVVPKLPGPFEIVASTGLLTQLIDAVVHSVGEWHAQFLELVQAIRAGHLRLLTELIAPGGVGVLITDVVSSDTYPDLDAVAEEALPGLLGSLVQQRNFFHGTNPTVLAALFRSDPVLHSQVSDVEVLNPWRWNLGSRIYLVTAIKVRKKGGR